MRLDELVPDTPIYAPKFANSGVSSLNPDPKKQAARHNFLI
jgi:hypothetical protein